MAQVLTAQRVIHRAARMTANTGLPPHPVPDLTEFKKTILQWDFYKDIVDDKHVQKELKRVPLRFESEQPPHRYGLFLALPRDSPRDYSSSSSRPSTTATTTRFLSIITRNCQSL